MSARTRAGTGRWAPTTPAVTARRSSRARTRSARRSRRGSRSASCSSCWSRGSAASSGGLAYAGMLRLGLHYLTAWTQDDLTANGLIPDGRITVLGADLSLNALRAGHLYIGAARTQATNAGSVSGAIEILNARGGPELIEH